MITQSGLKNFEISFYGYIYSHHEIFQNHFPPKQTQTLDDYSMKIFSIDWMNCLSTIQSAYSPPIPHLLKKELVLQLSSFLSSILDFALVFFRLFYTHLYQAQSFIFVLKPLKKDFINWGGLLTGANG